MLQENAGVFSEATRRALAALGSAPQPRRGLIAGAVVETPEGKRSVETLAAGDRVRGLDGRPKQILRIDRARIEGRAALDSLRQAVLVPAGLFGNEAPFVALPEQLVLFHAPRARAVLGTDYALVPGKALARHPGVLAVEPTGPFEVVSLAFQEEEAIWVNTGLLVQCPAADEAGANAGANRFPLLAGRSAAMLMELLSRPVAASSPSPFRGAQASQPRRVKATGRRRAGDQAAEA